MIKKLIFFVLAIMLTGTLTSCEIVKIVDFVHKDLYEVNTDDGINFSNPKFKKYQINNVLIRPLISRVDNEKNGKTYDAYFLNLVVYKEGNNNSIVTINSFAVKPGKNTEIKNIDVKLNKILKFEKEKGDILISDLIYEDIYLNDKPIKLNDKSTLKVILNVSVKDKNKTFHQSITYTYKTDIVYYPTTFQ